MDLYYLLLLLVVSNCLVQKKYKLSSLNIIVFFILGILCAIRGVDVGADTETYLQIYGSWTAIDFYKPEFCFYIICSVFKYLDCPPYYTQIFLSLLVYSLYITLLKKWSFEPSISILVFLVSFFGYYFETFNIVRQATATAFLLWSWFFIEKQKYKKGILMYFLAIGFHATSLLYLPLIFIALWFKLSYGVMIISLLISLMFAFVFSNVGFLGNIIQQLSMIMALGSGDYSTYANYNLGLTKTTFGLITLILPPSYLCLVSYRYLKNKFYYRLFFWGVIILNCLSIMPTSYRMVYGIIVLELILYPIVLRKASYNVKLITYMLILIEMLFFINDETYLKSSSLIPYNTIFS